MINKFTLVIAVLVALVLGTGIGHLLPRHSMSMKAMSKADQASPEKDRKPLYYRNPMNPAITSPVPAKDEMGMDYVPVYANEDRNQVAGTVRIDPATIQSIGVRTARAIRRTLSHIVHAPARITYDEQHVVRLHPKVKGWVVTLAANETGQQIRKGEVLLSIYSPNLVTTQQEYLLTLEQLDAARKTGSMDAIAQAGEISDAARQRLELLDVPASAIKGLERTRHVRRTLNVVSPVDGTITRIGARQGQYISPGTVLFDIADLSTVWVNVDVYEQDLPWIRAGDPADMQVLAVPARTWTGTIDYIYPYMDPKTRTARVRLAFTNDGGLLKPDMFANVNIHTSARYDAIVVPSEAVIRSGLHEQVFLAKPGGKFEPRDIKTGITADGMTQVLTGLQAGEQVVTSAQFLIDSESKLNEATAKMLEATESKNEQMTMMTSESKQ